jgi:hypothetical protein
VDGKYEPVDLGSFGLIYEDLEVAVSAMENLVWHLNALIRDADFLMNRATASFDRDGNRFWIRLGT